MRLTIICSNCRLEKENKGRGLCGACYVREWRANNPELAREVQKHAHKKYSLRNREKITKRNRLRRAKYKLSAPEKFARIKKQNISGVLRWRARRKKLSTLTEE